MRTSKSSLLAALLAVFFLSLAGAPGAQAAKSFDGYVELDSSCRSGARSETVTGYLATYVSGRNLHFSGLEPLIRTRPVGTTTTTPASQYVHVRWGMRHWDHMGPGKDYDEWQGWKLARANRYGTYDSFGYYVGMSSSTWWDTSTGKPSLEQNGLDWTVDGSYYQNAYHTPLLEVIWYNPANSAQSVRQAYLVPIDGQYNARCYLQPDGYRN
jgi:hypothetical protein